MENGCRNLTDVVRSVQLLKINGFRLATTMGNYECIKSRHIVDGYDWEIDFYPSTTPPYRTGKWVALKLVLVTEACTRNVRAGLACRLIDPRGSLQLSQEKTMSHVFKHCNDYSDLVVLVETLQGSRSYLMDDCLTVQCAIKVLREMPEPGPCVLQEVHVPASNLHSHLAELLQSERGADVTFLVSGESFAAHKAILSARSPVLLAEFFGHMKEKSSQCIEVKDMEASAFKAMLHFIYTDAVPELDQQLEVVTVMAQHLLEAADRYGLDRLKSICEAKLSGGITVDTAATTLALADQHSSPQLKAKCVELIVQTPAVLDAVLATEGYKHLEASCTSVLADLLKYACGRKN